MKVLNKELDGWSTIGEFCKKINNNGCIYGGDVVFFMRRSVL